MDNGRRGRGYESGKRLKAYYIEGRFAFQVKSYGPRKD